MITLPVRVRVATHCIRHMEQAQCMYITELNTFCRYRYTPLAFFYVYTNCCTQIKLRWAEPMILIVSTNRDTNCLSLV